MRKKKPEELPVLYSVTTVYKCDRCKSTDVYSEVTTSIHMNNDTTTGDPSPTGYYYCNECEDSCSIIIEEVKEIAIKI